MERNWLKKNCNFCNRNHFWGKIGVDSAKDKRRVGMHKT